MKYRHIYHDAAAENKESWKYQLRMSYGRTEI